MNDMTVRSPIKECDVRGEFPSEVNKPLFKTLGRNLGRMIAATHFDGFSPMTAVVGGDARLSTPELKKRILAGLATQGVRVLNLGGAVPTPVIYWAKEAKKAQAVAVVTASHNRPSWNGLKVMNGALPPTAEDIRQLAREDNETEAEEMGTIEFWDDARAAYIEDKAARFADTDLSRLNVVVDPGNGCQVGVASKLFETIGAKVTAIHDVLDGTFPERHPDCAVAEHIADLSKKVVETGADLGIAFDGDGDRLAVVDDTGRVISPERVAMILLSGSLDPKGGRPVVIDIKSTMHLDSAVAALGGVAVRCRSGHAYMKSKVIETGAILGSEVSGHHFLGDLHGLDDPLHVALILAGDLAKGDQPLSKKVDSLPRQFMTRDLRLAMDDGAIEALLEICRGAFDDARVETIDGVRLIWADGWFLARRSVTEQGMTFRLEGASGEALQRIGTRIAEALPAIAAPVVQGIAKILAGS